MNGNDLGRYSPQLDPVQSRFLWARSLTVAVLYLQEKPSNRTATVRERATKAGDPKSSLFRYPARSNNNCNRFELIVIRMPMVTN
jgi:hypothetical protein